LAACFKWRGILVPIAVTSLGVWVAWPYTPRRFAVIVLSCAAALAPALHIPAGDLIFTNLAAETRGIHP
jgi:hypothetical protein